MKRKNGPASDSIEQSPIPTSFGYKPWILQSKGTKQGFRKFINPFDGNIVVKEVPEMEGMICLGFFREEWILLLDPRSNEICFMNFPSSYKKVHLPPMSESYMSLGGCVISSSPIIPKCLVIFVGKNENFVLFYRPNDHKWTKIIYDFNFTGEVIFCRGNVYALLSESRTTAFTSAESLLGMAKWTFTDISGWNPADDISSYLLISHEDLLCFGVLCPATGFGCCKSLAIARYGCLQAKLEKCEKH
jgi:hypothetical protein